MDVHKLSLEEKKRLHDRPIPPLSSGRRDPRPRFREPVINQDEDHTQLWPDLLTSFIRDFLLDDGLFAEICIADRNDLTWAFQCSDIQMVEKVFLINNRWKRKLQEYFWGVPVHIQFCSDIPSGSQVLPYKLSLPMRRLMQIQLDSCNQVLDKVVTFGTGAFQVRYRFGSFPALYNMRLLKRYADSLRLGQFGQPLDSVRRKWPSNFAILYSKLQSLTFGLCFIKEEAQELMHWLINTNLTTLSFLSMPMRRYRHELLKRLELDTFRVMVAESSDDSVIRCFEMSCSTLIVEVYGKSKMKVLDSLLRYPNQLNPRIRTVDFVWHGLGTDHMRFLERLEQFVRFFAQNAPRLGCLRIRDGRQVQMCMKATEARRLAWADRCWHRVLHYRQRFKELAHSMGKELDSLAFCLEFEVPFYSPRDAWTDSIYFVVRADHLYLSAWQQDEDGQRERVIFHRRINMFELTDREFGQLVAEDVRDRMPRILAYPWTPHWTSSRSPNYVPRPVDYKFVDVDLDTFHHGQQDKTEHMANYSNLEEWSLVKPKDIQLDEEIRHRDIQMEVTVYRRRARQDEQGPEQGRLPPRTFTNHKFMRRLRLWASPSLPDGLRREPGPAKQRDFTLKCLRRPRKRRTPQKKISLP